MITGTSFPGVSCFHARQTFLLFKTKLKRPAVKKLSLCIPLENQITSEGRFQHRCYAGKVRPVDFRLGRAFDMTVAFREGKQRFESTLVQAMVLVDRMNSEQTR